MTASGNVSNHYFGRAMDIASVDGVSCTDTAVDAPCAKLARTLAYLPAPAHPTELIYCFDVDGPGRSVRPAGPLRSRPRRLRRLSRDSAPRRRTRPLA